MKITDHQNYKNFHQNYRPWKLLTIKITKISIKITDHQNVDNMAEKQSPPDSPPQGLGAPAGLGYSQQELGYGRALLTAVLLCDSWNNFWASFAFNFYVSKYCFLLCLVGVVLAMLAVVIRQDQRCGLKLMSQKWNIGANPTYNFRIYNYNASDIHMLG
jgi:hypothetical protein